MQLWENMSKYFILGIPFVKLICYYNHGELYLKRKSAFTHYQALGCVKRVNMD